MADGQSGPSTQNNDHRGNLRSMDRDKGQWFVVHTLSGQENRVKGRLESQLRQAEGGLDIYEILIPTEKVSEVKQGKRTTVTRKFFPGYILVRMDLFDEVESDQTAGKDQAADPSGKGTPPARKMRNESWHFVRQTQGVIGFLGCGETPVPLSPREVNDLLMQMSDEQDKVKPKVAFEVGESVRIKDGAFENFEGVIQDYDPSRGKLTLMVSIFGRSTPVELEFWQVEKE
jgi:transcriptional antiterminator NusG